MRPPAHPSRCQHGVIVQRRCFTSAGGRCSVLPGLFQIALDGFGCRPKQIQMALDGDGPTTRTSWHQVAPDGPALPQMATDCQKGSRWHQMLAECPECNMSPLKLIFCSLSSGRSRIRKMWFLLQIALDGPGIPRWLQMIPDVPR